MSDNESHSFLDEEDSIPCHQPNVSGVDVLGGDSEFMLPLETEAELPSSCDTYISQQSEKGEVQGIEENLVKEGHMEQSYNSNKEDEANHSVLCASPSSIQSLDQSLSLSVQEESHTKEIQIEEEKDNSSFQVISHHSERKRKKMSSEEESPDHKKPCNIEINIEEKEQKKVVSFIDISSSPEKSKTHNDSQDFSLRVDIEEDSPPSETARSQSEPAKGESGSWKSHSQEINNATSNSPSLSGLSQKNVNSWCSHNHTSPTWSSHKQDDERKSPTSKDNSENNKFEIMNSGSSPEHFINSNNDTPKGRKVVIEERVLFATVNWILDEETNSIISGEIKQVSLLDENDKASPRAHGRMSMLSTTTTASSVKSSSSSGSVGLPGPFQLPGLNRMSIMSCVSSSSSSSGTSHLVGRQAWDGPFLKPASPAGSRVPLVCGHCSHLFPPLERKTTPIVNGMSRIKEEELVIPKGITTPKRNRRGSKASQSQSSGAPDDEGSSGADAVPLAPQAASTPTPLRKKGRPRKGTPFANQRRVSGSSPPPAPAPSSAPASRPKPAAKSAKEAARVSNPIESEDFVEEKVPQPPSRAKAATPVRTPAQTPSPPKPESSKGVAVMARWSDGRYYPGWVAELPSPGSGAGGMQVHFCDGQRKVVPSARLVAAAVITPGALILVDTDEGEYEQSLVINVRTEGDVSYFTVERDSVEKEVPFASVALLESQVAELTMTEAQRAAATQNFNDLSLDNIVSGPRKRPASSFAKMARGSPAPSPSSKRRKRQATPEPSTSHGRTYEQPARRDLSVDSDSSCQSTCSVDIRGLEMKPLDVECSPPEVGQTSKRKLQTYRRNKNFRPKKEESEDEHLVEVLGPIPEAGSQLFSGCTFLITHTSQVELTAAENIPTTSATSDHEDESTNKSYVPPLWKERLRTQIKRGGGKVFKGLSQVSKDELKHTYLITDKPCSTPLYLECVVNDVPIYSTSVILQCCRQNKQFTEVVSARGTRRLPAGYSLARGTTVPAKTGAAPLRNRTLLLSLSSPHAVAQFWQSLVVQAGGTAEIFSGRCLERDRFHVVVTDPGCPPELVEQACQQQLPLVSLTWLQQCIVNGDWRSYTEHPLYKHNASEGSESPEY